MTATAQPYVTELPFLPPPPQYGYALRYASLTSRLGAQLVDLVIVGLLSLFIAIPFGLLAAFSVLTTGGLAWVGFLYGPLTLITFGLWIAYFSFFESTSGQTPGKKALGVKVVSTITLQPPDLGHALLRNLLRIVDWLPALYLLGFLVAAASTRSQRIGD
ncbi:MAG: RDD family protein, partial [Thermoplasmata archaeon]|nr:RDD family protein [Thermoplasmata archaeon]